MSLSPNPSAARGAGPHDPSAAGVRAVGVAAENLGGYCAGVPLAGIVLDYGCLSLDRI